MQISSVYEYIYFSRKHVGVKPLTSDNNTKEVNNFSYSYSFASKH